MVSASSSAGARRRTDRDMMDAPSKKLLRVFCAEGPDLRAVFSWLQSRFVAVFLPFVRRGIAECLGNRTGRAGARLHPRPALRPVLFPELEPMTRRLAMFPIVLLLLLLPAAAQVAPA